MGPGFAVTKESGTDPFAERFHEAGFTVLDQVPTRSWSAAEPLASWPRLRSCR
jgi:hypothetical protein